MDKEDDKKRKKKVAEFLFTESIITEGRDNVAITRLYADEITGKPTRVEFRSSTRHPYRFYIGNSERTDGQISRGDTTIESTLADRIDVRSASNWVFSVEGD